METFSPSTKSRFHQLIEFIRDYRIRISITNRLAGVGDTLIGWAFIAINTVFFPPPTDTVLSGISFIVFFLAGSLSLLVYALYQHAFLGNFKEAIKSLLIRNDTETHIDAIHLSASQRIRWIYFRGFIATGGYIAYNISKNYFGVIDNSAIFGADALIYALLAFLILKEKLTFKEVSGIAIASIGVLFVAFVDVQGFNIKNGIIAGSAGIISAITLSIIFFITGIIVRHDSPKRVAFHQCLAGVILSLCAFCFILLSKGFHVTSGSISPDLLQDSIISGMLYAVSLVFFLRAFLRTEPIVIAVVGYSLGIFVILFEWLFNDELIGSKDIISAILIGLGCFLLIHEEYVKDKKPNKKLNTQKPTYQMGLRENLASLQKQFLAGSLDRYSYLSEKHEFNKLLLEYAAQIKNTPIEKIQILPDALVFTFHSPLKIEVQTDGRARSAPFEILNFGSYEKEDEEVAYRLLSDGDTILDIGAHIGWYAINFAKRFPYSQIYAFEPIADTFQVLKRNIARNQIANITLNNFGCSNEDAEKYFYYFKGGSALASIKNLIDHKNVQKIQCKLKRVDTIVQELNIASIDFMKCDIEGSELFAFQGAIETIKKFKPIIFTELYEEWCQKCNYSSLDVLKLLSDLGYTPYQSVQGRLVEVAPGKLNDEEHYNYFFLNKLKHSKKIRELSKEI